MSASYAHFQTITQSSFRLLTGCKIEGVSYQKVDGGKA